MTYALMYVKPLNVYRMLCETTMDQTTLTEEELRARFKGDAILNQWADFAKANPGKDCVYDMLPK